MGRPRVYRTKGRRYSGRAKAIVKRYMHEKTYEEIAQMIGRSEKSVRQFVNKTLREKKREGTRRWKPEEAALVKRYFGTTSCEDIGQKLGRTAMSVYRKAKRMKLCIDNKYDGNGVMMKTRKRGCAYVWRASEISYMKQNFATETCAAMCEYLGVSKYSIYKKAAEIGLKRDPEALKARKRMAIDQAILQHVINSHKKQKNGNIPKLSGDSGITSDRLPHV